MTTTPNRYKSVGYVVNTICSGTMNSQSRFSPEHDLFWLVLLALIFVLAGSLEF